MIKTLLILLTLVSCGSESEKDNSAAAIDGISTEQSLPYQGVLEVMDGSNPCFGGSFYYIEHENKRYQVSDFSSQTFKDTIQSIFDGESKFKPFEAGGCHNKYTFHFQGKMTKEMKWVGAGEVMTDVIQVEAFSIK